MLYSMVGFPDGIDGRESAYNIGDPASIPGFGISPGEENGIFAENIVWTEELGGLQSMASQRVAYDYATNTFTFSFVQYLFVTKLCLSLLHCQENSLSVEPPGKAVECVCVCVYVCVCVRVCVCVYDVMRW